MIRMILVLNLFVALALPGDAQLDSLQSLYHQTETMDEKIDLLILMAEQHKANNQCDSAFILFDKAILMAEEESLNKGQSEMFEDINLSLSLIVLALSGLLLSLVFAIMLINQKNKNNKVLAEKNELIRSTMLEKDTLLREIHHRVKNNLQVISSLLSMQGRFTNDPNIESAIREGKDRVKSMSLIHQNLYQKDNLKGVDIQEYFTKLFNSLFSSYNIKPDKINLTLNIAPISLDVDSIVPIGLVVNELVSNSLKHAFPDDREGNISVSLTEDTDQIILIVQDDGIGIKTDSLADNESIGYTLLETFKNKLNAEVEIIGDGGTKISLHIKKYNKVA